MLAIISTKRSSPPILPIAEPIFDWIHRELLKVPKFFSSAVIAKFHRLLPRHEPQYFPLGFRIRQWLSLNFDLEASDPLNRVNPEKFSISPLAQVLSQVKSLFFECTTESIPFDDIRVTVRSDA